MSSEKSSSESKAKPHPNDNIEILYKPYIAVHSDYESDETPKRKKNDEHIATPTVALRDATEVSTTDFRKDGFKHSYFEVDEEALLYTTLPKHLLAKKLATFNYHYEGYAAPSYKLGEVDRNRGYCKHCGKYSWSCHEVRFGNYCFKAVRRHFKNIKFRNICPEDAYVVFINFYNRALDFTDYDEQDDSDKEPDVGHTDHRHPSKCMDFGSLIRTLEWAYWHLQRMEEKLRKKRAKKENWMTKALSPKVAESKETVEDVSK